MTKALTKEEKERRAEEKRKLDLLNTHSLELADEIVQLKNQVKEYEERIICNDMTKTEEMWRKGFWCGLTTCFASTILSYFVFWGFKCIY